MAPLPGFLNVFHLRVGLLQALEVDRGVEVPVNGIKAVSHDAIRFLKWFLQLPCRRWVRPTLLQLLSQDD